MNTPIFIEYETKNREFDGKLLLINYLLNAGFTKIYIGAAIPIRNEALSHTNGIYFFKSAWKDEENLYKQLKNRGFLLVLMHAEGGIYSKDNVKSIELLYNKSVIEYFDINFNFGKNIKQDIDKLYGDDKNFKNVISGEPRFDLLKPKFNALFHDSVNNLKNKYNNFILINTNFAVGNHSLGSERVIDLWKNSPILTEDTVNGYIRMMGYQAKVIDEFLSAISYISNRFPEINFIIRPHPSESQNLYIEKFKERKNIIVSKDNNVAIWIIASMGVIHYDCTTGIEAILAEKPVISYIPLVDEKFVAWLPIKTSKQVKNIKELAIQIELIMNHKFDNNNELKYKNLLEDSIFNFKSDSSPIIISHILSSINNRNLLTSEFQLRNTTVFNIIYNFKAIIKKIIKYEKIMQINSADKFGRTSLKEINYKILSLKYILNFSFEFHIRKHTIDSFFIEKK